jgi:hypothetical protein
MKNEHLIPVNVIDIVNKLSDSSVRENELNNYVMRLEAIRDYCSMSLNTHSRDKKSFLDKETRSKLNYSRAGAKNV